MIKKGIFLITLTLLVVSCGTHTENAEEVKKSDSAAEIERVSIAEIEAGIKSYIDKKVEEGDGYFQFSDDGKVLRLKLVRVHTEYLSNLGPGRHFACVDLADVSGDVYDVDFFLEGSAGDMEITQTTLHKLNGKPFYSWKQREDKSWYRVPMEEASRELLGVIEKQDEFEFYYHFKLPELTQQAEVWIPLAESDDFQSVEILSIKSPVEYQILKEQEYGNSMIYIKAGSEHSGQEVKINYHVQRKEKGPYEATDTELEKYLKPDSLVPVNDRFREIARQAIQEKYKEGKLVQARALYDYIIDNMKYMKFGNYGRGDANYACDSKTGNCTEFHSFFIALARSAGIPARFAIGASIPSERDEGGIDGYHCWAEFYAEGKWWPVDISEADKYSALATYYFGRHPANRVEFSRGRDLVVEPGPDSGPINFHAYPVLETGSELKTPQTSFTFKRGSS